MPLAHLILTQQYRTGVFEAALRASGSTCEAVDRVMYGDHWNAFCAVRPPGHHAGLIFVVTCPNDPDGSHGFCLLNNVALATAMNLKGNSSHSSGRESHCDGSRGGGSITFNLMLSNFAATHYPCVSSSYEHHFQTCLV
uniref:Histone deacetylase domain-containing protein n=1 Tax=Proboscia inermis TaxID=420281 RepID=A0A6T8P9B9_9STRA|mmetsp:Transcript_7426/g.7615  ORF Transcript_7426/g.7615 Transcript_7426/m.7615 type:complete len:139 (+) Transcript_7426:692-1108(+)